jgi:hypothetical protein
VNNLKKRVSTRKKLLAGTAGVIIAASAIAGSCNYTIHSNNTPSAAVVELVEDSLISSNPGRYIDTATSYARANPDEMLHYQDQVSEFVLTAENLDLLGDDARLTLFQANASKVNPDYGIGVCEKSVMPRATEKKKLEHIVSGIRLSDSKHYGTFILTMAEKIGSDLYNLIREKAK